MSSAHADDGRRHRESATSTSGAERSVPRRPGDTRATLRWERAAYWPLTLAALVFLIAYTVQILRDVSGELWQLTLWLVSLSYLAFIVDYVVRLAMARPRLVWVRSHLLDLGVVLLPVLRPVRLLDAFARLPMFTMSPAASLRSRLLIYGSGSALLLVWYFSLMVLSVERHAPGANITSFGDALWWAFCTLTTVGYGDYTPVTAIGRLFAIVLMLSGVVLVGLVVATFSSWVVERATQGHDDQLPASRADIRALEERLVSGSGALPRAPRPAGGPDERGA